MSVAGVMVIMFQQSPTVPTNQPREVSWQGAGRELRNVDAASPAAGCGGRGRGAGRHRAGRIGLVVLAPRCDRDGAPRHRAEPDRGTLVGARHQHGHACRDPAARRGTAGGNCQAVHQPARRRRRPSFRFRRAEPIWLTRGAVHLVDQHGLQHMRQDGNVIVPCRYFPAGTRRVAA